jgi:hypothetical protein
MPVIVAAAFVTKTMFCKREMRWVKSCHNQPNQQYQNDVATYGDIAARNVCKFDCCRGQIDATRIVTLHKDLCSDVKHKQVLESQLSTVRAGEDNIRRTSFDRCIYNGHMSATDRSLLDHKLGIEILENHSTRTTQVGLVGATHTKHLPENIRRVKLTVKVTLTKSTFVIIPVLEGRTELSKRALVFVF